MLQHDTFNRELDGKAVRLLELHNAHGMRVHVTNYGAKLVSLYAPDADGALADVLLGFNTLDEWLSKETYFNAVIGRCANRIRGGHFELDGESHQLAVNNGPNHLHGGVSGFNERVWEITEVSPMHVRLTYVSPDGEEAYPGELRASVTYQLTNDNALEISYEATCDKPTIVGFTQHAYFNLRGEGSGDVRDHVLQVFADQYTPFDETACPTGEIAEVAGTPMDFREPVRIGERIDDVFFAPGRGIDNNFVLRKSAAAGQPELAAVLSADKRRMEVWTTMPGLQVYTGNYVEHNVGKSGRCYDVQHAVCMEAQNFPDAIHHAQFPSPILRPGESYRHRCIYRFV
ncbi:MAG: galactose mutarotase [Paludibacteraceae bacterium]|nr:galactose mutarotase [Paludibacteraceae bacterium]